VGENARPIFSRYKIWGLPSATNWGNKTTFLGRRRNLTATLTAYVFGTKHYVVSKCPELWSTNGFKLDRNFTHPM